MKFLCDVHIPISLSKALEQAGYESNHVNRILNGSQTSDANISRFADQNNFIVITKDRDFLNSFLISKSPKKVLLIETGNISNADLLDLIFMHLERLKLPENQDSFLAQLDRSKMLIVHP